MASGGTIGVFATGALLTGGTAGDIAYQNLVEQIPLSEIDYFNSLNSGLMTATIGGPATRLMTSAGVVGSASRWTLLPGMTGYGAYESTGHVLQGYETDNWGQVLYGGIGLVTLGGGLGVAKWGEGINLWPQGGGLLYEVPNTSSSIATRERVLSNIAESRAAREASRIDVHRGFETALFGDVSTAPNSAVFFSGRAPGGLVNADLATEFARTNNRSILNFTPAGRRLDALNLYPRLVLGENGRPSPRYAAETQRVWDIASSRFAQNASGEVTTFSRGALPESVFHRIELPTLERNPNVTNIVNK